MPRAKQRAGRRRRCHDGGGRKVGEVEGTVPNLRSVIRVDAATVLLQWAAGGLFFLWFTTRRREVGIGYGWLLRGTYLLLALGAAAAGFQFGLVPVREASAPGGATEVVRCAVVDGQVQLMAAEISTGRTLAQVKAALEDAAAAPSGAVLSGDLERVALGTAATVSSTTARWP